ncbi:beta-lactamase-like protein [Xylariaceae sp. FL0804]|nr:beta-lactamase-like protein [Xylariaceae sp. FL0804]
MASPSEGEPGYDPVRTGAWLVCTACGTQVPTASRDEVATCFICDDPRQFTPPSGQAFTSLDELRAGGRHRNVFTPFPLGHHPDGNGKDEDDARFTSIATHPKVAIGQRAVLVRTPRGNVLWDCVTLLDGETVAEIRRRGGLAAIVISHPHYYTTHVEWARAFACPVYLAAEDRGWLAQRSSWQRFIPEGETEMTLPPDGGKGKEEGKEGEDGEEEGKDGVRVLKLGGHFPGSLVALHAGRLLIADTLVTTPAGMGSWAADARGHVRDGGGSGGRPRGMNSFAFMWSIPNMIPLAPDELARMWRVLGRHAFRSTHGAFVGTEIHGTSAEMRRRVLESMQIQIRYSGHGDHAMLRERID